MKRPRPPSRKTHSIKGPAGAGSFPIVAIGASAGGLEAFTQFLRALPNDTGMAFVFIQHLDPSHPSMLTELLSKTARIPVVEARHRVKLRANHVYVIPPNVKMGLLRDHLLLTARGANRAASVPMPIDYFMRTLAEERKGQAIGVVLSGTASDGTLGLAAIKAEGGITFVQEPTSAQYDGMPRSAIASGCVDSILSPEDISRELGRISQHPYFGPAEAAAAEKHIASNGDYDSLFVHLRRTTGVDFRQYKPATIRRRTLRRMALLRIDGVSDYVKYLSKHPEETEPLFQDLLIPVTGFFRDPQVFEALKRKVFPAILKDQSNKGNIRLWTPGCSTGEETYSLAMVLLEFLGERASRFHIQIFGSDVNERGIDTARSGLYSNRVAQEVSAERLRRFFVKVDEGFRVSKAVRDLCVFARQNLCEDPPFSQMNLVACRNLLIYFGSAAQSKIIHILHYALKPSGFLMLGSAESVAAFPSLFAPADKKHKIFAKKATVTHLHYDFPTSRYLPTLAIAATAAEQPAPGNRASDLQQEADRIVLKNHAPAGVVINGDMEILQFRGHTSPYLEPAPGRASLNLLKMARGGLAVDLRTVINQARKKRAAVRRKDVQFEYHGEHRSVTISVEPLDTRSASHNNHYLVLLKEAPSPPRARTSTVRASATRAGRDSRNRDFLQLHKRLADTEQHLRSIIESKEATDEEFQSANEEILSANEELQSTNEELETSKEELQSANEELNTLNDELRHRNTDLNQLNSDLNNLLSSTTLPVVMIDRALRIRRLTAAATKVLRVLPSDIGRPITDIRLHITVSNLERLIAEAIDVLTTKEVETQDEYGNWYSLQIRPYRTVDDKIDGVVLVLTNINDLKRSSEGFRKAKEFAEGIIDTVREPLVVLDTDLRVIYCNSSFSKGFRGDSQKIEGKLLYHLGKKQWNVPELRTRLEQVAANDIPIENLEVIHDFPRLGRRTMLLNARRIHDGSGAAPLILLAIEDITERQHADETRRRLSRRLLRLQDEERRRIARELHDSVGQYLAGVKMNLAPLEHLALPKSEMARLSESQELLDRCVAEIRTISYLLHPPLLDETGFASASRWYVEGFAKRSGVQVNLELPPELGRLPTSVEIALFRVLQESLTNVHRHSGSPRVDVRVDLGKDQVGLEVRDYGRGLPLEQLKRDGEIGVGLAGMRERLSDLGGSIRIVPENPGTLVSVIVPTAQKPGTRNESGPQGADQEGS